MLARKAIPLISPEAWVIDDTGIKKDGTASLGVARQYSGTLGKIGNCKIGNCKIGVSVHAVTEQASCALDWRLFLPEGWQGTGAETNDQAELIAARRRKTQIPDSVRHRTKWELALEMLDELASWGHRLPLICADAGYGEITDFRLSLSERGIAYVVAVKSTTSAHPAEAAPELMDCNGRGPRPHTIRYPQAPSPVKDLAGARETFVEITCRHGTKTSPGSALAAMTSRFTALRVRPGNRNNPRQPHGSLPECWLVAEWPANTAQPTDCGLSTLPEDTSLPELVRLAKFRWRIEHDYRELKHGHGLAHFEGRTWPGRHHHVTATSTCRSRSSADITTGTLETCPTLSIPPPNS